MSEYLPSRPFGYIANGAIAVLLSIILVLANVTPSFAVSNITITYNSNQSQHQTGSTSGTVAAPQVVAAGTPAVVAAKGDLARQGFSFAGWNTANDGSGTTYAAGTGSITSSVDITLYAKWEIPQSARLFGAVDGSGNRTENIVPIKNGAASLTDGFRGITNDGSHVFYMPSGSANTIREVGFDGAFVADHTVAAAADGFRILHQESTALAYSSGCIFIRDGGNANSPLYCVDVSDWSLTKITIPGINQLLLGQGWLRANLIDFPDGRIGAVSQPNTFNSSSAFSPFAGADKSLCGTTGIYCKVLRLFSPTGSGKTISLAFSEDLILADDDSSFPSDDHGLATDGTYLYQSRYQGGYKVYALRTGALSYVAFNGNGSGACGASTGVSNGFCDINPVISGHQINNATFFTHDHTNNRYLMGDYGNTGQMLSTMSAAPPAGPGSIAVPSEPLNLVAAAGDTKVTLTWSLPASQGGAEITGYLVAATPGGGSCATTTALTCEISGLTNGQSYTFTVHATNRGGDSIESNSASATPVAPAPPPALAPPAPAPDPIPVAPKTLPPQPVKELLLTRSNAGTTSTVNIQLPTPVENAAITGLKVKIFDAMGTLLQELSIPVIAGAADLKIEIPRDYGDFDISVAAVNSAGISADVLAAGGLVQRNTTNSATNLATPTLKGIATDIKALFKPNSSELTNATKANLIALKNQLTNFKGRILLTGFTANYGSKAKAARIAAQRAQAVGKFLQSLGLTNWIEYYGYGKLPMRSSTARRVAISLLPAG